MGGSLSRNFNLVDREMQAQRESDLEMQRERQRFERRQARIEADITRETLRNQLFVNTLTAVGNRRTSDLESIVASGRDTLETVRDVGRFLAETDVERGRTQAERARDAFAATTTIQDIESRNLLGITDLALESRRVDQRGAIIGEIIGLPAPRGAIQPSILTEELVSSVRDLRRSAIEGAYLSRRFVRDFSREQEEASAERARDVDFRILQATEAFSNQVTQTLRERLSLPDDPVVTFREFEREIN